MNIAPDYIAPETAILTKVKGFNHESEKGYYKLPDGRIVP